MIKIVLAEDQHIVRNGIRMLLETDPNIKIVEEAVNEKQVLSIVESVGEIDMVLTTIHMSETDEVGLVKTIKQLDPKIHIVVLSMHGDENHVLETFVEGASGYILKNVSAEELIFAIKFISNGGKYLCAELTAKMVENAINNKNYSDKVDKLVIDFSLREREVLHHIAEGLTNSEMSEKLFISKRTIEGHRQSLIEKTSSRNTAALIRFAMLNGIIN